MELKKTVIRAIKSRQINLEKKNGYSVYSLQEKMNELLEKGKVNVGGRQTCSKTDPTWDFYMAWLQVVNIFNKYQKEMRIDYVRNKSCNFFDIPSEKFKVRNVQTKSEFEIYISDLRCDIYDNGILCSVVS